jgi:hypothetical protein
MVVSREDGPLNLGPHLNGLVAETRVQIRQFVASLPSNLADFQQCFCVFLVKDSAAKRCRSIFCPYGLGAKDATHATVTVDLDALADMIQPLEALVRIINSTKSNHNPGDDVL